jgi:magnesium chelatase family protein
LIESITSNELKDEIAIKRPFRSPHHSASPVSIIGGGKNIVPGEVTLSHKGVLFLDELAEFHPATLDALREPLESGVINISRVNKHIEYPADFQLVGAMNPCKCGYLGNKAKQCNKVPDCANQYQKKMSGPFLDRIDIMINISGEYSDSNLFSKKDDKDLEGDPQFAQYRNSAVIRERVEVAREIQYQRYRECDFKLNAKAIGDLENLLKVETEANNFLKGYCEKNNLSMRGYNKILKLARTIADLAGEDFVNRQHILEAMYFRLSNIS